jgi:hypothetical protein
LGTLRKGSQILEFTQGLGFQNPSQNQHLKTDKLLNLRRLSLEQSQEESRRTPFRYNVEKFGDLLIGYVA